MFSVQTDKGRSIKAEADLGSYELGGGGGGGCTEDQNAARGSGGAL